MGGQPVPDRPNHCRAPHVLLPPALPTTTAPCPASHRAPPRPALPGPPQRTRGMGSKIGELIIAPIYANLPSDMQAGGGRRAVWDVGCGLWLCGAGPPAPGVRRAAAHDCCSVTTSNQPALPRSAHPPTHTRCRPKSLSPRPLARARCAQRCATARAGLRGGGLPRLPRPRALPRAPSLPTPANQPTCPLCVTGGHCHQHCRDEPDDRRHQGCCPPGAGGPGPRCSSCLG